MSLGVCKFWISVTGRAAIEQVAVPCLYSCNRVRPYSMCTAVYVGPSGVRRRFNRALARASVHTAVIICCTGHGRTSILSRVVSTVYSVHLLADSSAHTALRCTPYTSGRYQLLTYPRVQGPVPVPLPAPVHDSVHAHGRHQRRTKR